MSTDPTGMPESETTGSQEAPDGKTSPKRWPWVTIAICVACIGIHLGISANGDSPTWETFNRFGYFSAEDIWRGSYWGLFTCAFVHLEMWHLVFNVYWLWELGRRLETSIGPWPYLALVAVSAGTASSFQLAASDSTGIGASGVVYAIFGFMWLARPRHPEFREIITTRIIWLFILWLVGCTVATHLQLVNVGNAAHASGLLFGLAAAGAFSLTWRSGLFRIGLVALMVLGSVPLWWCPWSVTWLGLKAYDAHEQHRYDEALERYTAIIRLDPRNSWAYHNRSGVYVALGQVDNAAADLRKARELDPSIAPGTGP